MSSASNSCHSLEISIVSWNKFCQDWQVSCIWRRRSSSASHAWYSSCIQHQHGSVAMDPKMSGLSIWRFPAVNHHWKNFEFIYGRQSGLKGPVQLGQRYSHDTWVHDIAKVQATKTNKSEAFQRKSEAFQRKNWSLLTGLWFQSHKENGQNLSWRLCILRCPPHLWRKGTPIKILGKDLFLQICKTNNADPLNLLPLATKKTKHFSNKTAKTPTRKLRDLELF